jgi:tetratricopeptide (TPR) repeat protein
LRPDWPEALNNLSDALRHDGEIERAVETQRTALSLRPSDENMRLRLAALCAKAGQFSEAEAICRAMLIETPSALAPRIALGDIFREQGLHDDAIATFEEILLHTPESAHEAYGNMAAVFADRGWHATAYTLGRTALVLNSVTPKIRLGHGLVALTLGHLSEGWSEYECRFDLASGDDDHVDKRLSPPPYWRGEDLTGKSILLWTEQGIGDEIIYSSMIPDIVQRARACVIACSARMAPIFARSFPDCAVIGFAGRANSLAGGEQFDFQSPIASLGGHLRPTFESFPQRERVLRADPALSAARRAYYEKLAQGRRIVGVSWRSTLKKGRKNAPLIDLAPILTAPGIFLVNLQYGDCGAELADVRATLGVEIHQDPTVDPLQDMDAFFAQVAAMDLVVTTSNTTAHVAGTQGVPVWIMLPQNTRMPWYWFLRHEYSVWYPSARLFHSTTDEKKWWQSVAQQIGARLRAK